MIKNIIKRVQWLELYRMKNHTRDLLVSRAICFLSSKIFI